MTSKFLTNMESQHVLGTGPRGMCLGLCEADAASPGSVVRVSQLGLGHGNSKGTLVAAVPRPAQEAYSTAWETDGTEEDVIALIRKIGFRSDETLPWLEDLAQEFNAPLTVDGIGISKGRVQLWPAVSEWTYDDCVYVYPEQRLVLGRCGIWQLVWLGEQEEFVGVREVVRNALELVPTLWTLDEALMAARRFGRFPTFPQGLGLQFETVQVQYALEVPMDLWRKGMKDRIPGRKIVDNVWSDLAFNLSGNMQKGKDLRRIGAVIDETVEAVSQASAQANWAREEKSVRQWYSWLRFSGEHPYPRGFANLGFVLLFLLGFLNEWISVGLYMYLSYFYAIDPGFVAIPMWWTSWVFFFYYPWWVVANIGFWLAWVWWTLWYSHRRIEYVVINARRRVSLRILDDWKFQEETVALQVETNPQEMAGEPDLDPPIPPHVPEAPVVEETLACPAWHFDSNDEGMEMIVPPDYYVSLSRGVVPETRTMETRLLGVHYQRSASFVVAKLRDGQPGIARTWNQIPVRPGFSLNLGPNCPELGPDYFGAGRVTYYQSFGLPGYWPSKTVHMLANTGAVRVGPQPPEPQPRQVGPAGEEWDFSRLRLLQTVTLPKVDFSMAIGRNVGDQDLVKELLNPDLPGTHEKLLALTKSMKPASMKRARDLIEKLLGGDLDLRELTEEGRIKVFCKGDELLFKPKGRLICFVPTVWWILTVIWLTEVLQVIKKNWNWKVKHCGVDCYWASGMTQHKLSTAFTSAMFDEAETDQKFVFVCGDDNIDSEDTSDASMYDSTQSGEFAGCQFASMNAAGLPVWVTTKMQKQHEQCYVAKMRENGILYKVNINVTKGKKKATSLPSGAAWTLFINSLGIIIYSGAVEIARREFYPKGYPNEETRIAFKQAVASALGLSMKVSPNPVHCDGAEFLKGQFILCKDSFWWSPLPSRLTKWSKALGTKVLTDEEMRQRLRGVALSNRDALLPPMLRVWVDAWVGTGGKTVAPDWEYKTVHYGADDEEALKELAAVQGQPEWALACERVICERYKLSVEDYDTMLEELKKWATEAGAFQGPHWARLALTDYVGL